MIHWQNWLVNLIFLSCIMNKKADQHQISFRSNTVVYLTYSETSLIQHSMGPENNVGLWSASYHTYVW